MLSIGLTWGHFSDGDNEVLFIVQWAVLPPPRHPASIVVHNTSLASVRCIECTVLVRESVVSRYEWVVRVLVHVLVRESVCTKSSRNEVYLTCALSCHWCVRVKCSGASDAVARDYKKDWKRDSKGLLYIFFVSRCVKCFVEMVHFICFYQKFCISLLEETLFIFPVSSPVTFFN